jgi:hypothetical protein
MMRNNIIMKLIKGSRILSLLLPCLMFSCEKWTPEADGYFVVDGVRHNVYILVVTPTSGGFFMQGAPWVNTTVGISSFNPGTYHVAYYGGPGSMNIEVRWSSSNVLQSYSDINSTGTMTIKSSGENFIMDFDGVIQGKKVQMHYAGLVGHQN